MAERRCDITPVPPAILNGRPLHSRHARAACSAIDGFTVTSHLEGTGDEFVDSRPGNRFGFGETHTFIAGESVFAFSCVPFVVFGKLAHWCRQIWGSNR